MTDSTGQRPRLRSRATRSEESYSCVQSDADEASDREAQPTSDPSSKKRKRVSNATPAQASTVPQEYIDLLPQRMPACYKSDQGNAFFTQKWFKEVSARDSFWKDLIRKIPKSVLNARISVQYNIGLDVSEDVQATTKQPLRGPIGKASSSSARLNDAQIANTEQLLNRTQQVSQPIQELAGNTAEYDDEAEQRNEDNIAHIAVTEDTNSMHPSITPAPRESTVLRLTLASLQNHSIEASRLPTVDAEDASLSQREATSDMQIPEIPQSATSSQLIKQEEYDYKQVENGDHKVKYEEDFDSIGGSRTTLARPIKQDASPRSKPIKTEDKGAQCTMADRQYAGFSHRGVNHFVTAQEVTRYVYVGGGVWYHVKLPGGLVCLPENDIEWLTRGDYEAAKNAEEVNSRLGRKRRGGREAPIKVE